MDVGEFDDDADNVLAEAFGASSVSLDKCTAPLRLQSPLRAEGVVAAYTGDFTLLGCRDDERHLSEMFHKHCYHKLIALEKSPVFDLAHLFGQIFLEASVTPAETTTDRLISYVETALLLANRQERAFTLGILQHPSDYDLSSWSAFVSRWTRSYFRARQYIQDMLLTYVDHSDGKRDYRPTFAREDTPWLMWNVPGSNWTFFYWRQGCFFGQSQTSFAFIPINSLKCIYEVVSARFLICLACDIASIHKNPLYPLASTVQELFDAGDKLLVESGNRAYNTIKKLEGLVIGSVIKSHDPGLLTNPEDYYYNLTADVRDFGTQREKDFCQMVHDLVCNSPNHHQSFQLFGLFRMWGYPHVDIIGGLDQVKLVAQQVKHIDLDLSWTIRYMAMESFFTSYHRSNGHYPPHKVLRSDLSRDSSVLLSLRRNLLIRQTDSRYELTDWQYVVPEKVFDPTESLATLDLLQDKACSGSRAETVHALRSRGRLPPARSRRTLLRYLAEENLDCSALLNHIDKHGFKNDDLIIGVTPKERELKVFPRLFSLMTLPVRTYFTATEHLLAEDVLPHFPEVVIGLDALEMKRTLQKASGMQCKDEEPESVSVALNFDFSRWNLNERAEALFPLFSFFDQLYGFDRVFSRTHEIFSQCTYYCADQYLLPDPDCLEAGRDGVGVWINHLGGMEGLRQKGWTVGTAMLIRYIERMGGVKSRLLGQGDNQILLLDYVLQRYVGGSADSTRFRERAKVHLTEFLGNLHDVFNRIGLPIKLSESWKSEILFAYGKDTYVKGSRVSMALKRISRMFFVSNELHPTYFHSVGSIFSAAESASENDINPFVAMTCGITELLCATELYWRWSPLRGRGISLGQPAFIRWRFRSDRPMEEYSQQRADRLSRDIAAAIECILLSSHDFGGYPVQNYYALSIRGFSDPLLLCMHFCDAYLRYNSAFMNPDVVSFLNAHYQPSLKAESDPDLAFTDPLGLNLCAPPSFVSKVKQFGASAMMSGQVRNKDIRFIYECSRTPLSGLSEIARHLSLFLPRLLNIFAENSAVGMADHIVSKFQNATTLQKAARSLHPGSSNSLEQSLGRLDLQTFAYFMYSGCKIKPTLFPLHETQGSGYQYAQQLRARSFGREDIAGVTCPLCLSYVTPVLAHRGCCELCTLTEKSPFCSIKIALPMLPEIYNRSALGPHRSYEGSVTQQKQSSFSPWHVVTKSAPFQCAKRISSLRGWLVRPNSNLDACLKVMTRALTDVPYDKISACITPVSSSATHRLIDPRSHHIGYPGNLSEQYTAVNVSTNTLRGLSGGNQDHPINFQHLICYSQCLPTLLSARGVSIPSQIHLHIRDLTELPILHDSEVEILPSADFDPSAVELPSFPSCSLLYAHAENLKIMFRPSSASKPTRLFDYHTVSVRDRNSTFDYVCAQLMFRSIHYFSDDVQLGLAPSTQLPHLYYKLCDPCETLTHLVRMLTCLACSSQWAYSTTLHLFHADAETNLAIWNATLYYITALPSHALEVVSGLFEVRASRVKLLQVLPPHIAPRDNPISVASSTAAARRALSYFAQLERESGGTPEAPFKYELQDDRPILTYYLHNSISNTLSSKEIHDVNRLREVLRDVTRGVSALYNKMTKEQSGSTSINMINLSWLVSVLKDTSPDSLNLVASIISHCVPQWSLLLTSQTLKLLPIRPDQHVGLDRAASVVHTDAADTLREIPLTQSAHYPKATVLSDDWFPAMQTPQYKSILRPLHLPTVAWYKWFEIVQETTIHNPVSYLAAVGDGCGGVTALCKLFHPQAVVAYNSLQESESGHIPCHTESYPTAVEALGLNDRNIVGCDIMTVGVSDMMDPSWPAFFLSVLPACDVIFCDANYGKTPGNGRKIAANIFNYLQLVASNDICKSMPKSFTMKSYFYSRDEIDQILDLFHTNFERVCLRQSIFSAAGSSECFITGSSLILREHQCFVKRPVSAIRVSKEGCGTAVEWSYRLTRDLVEKSWIVSQQMETLVGKPLILPELNSVLQEYSISDVPNDLLDAIRQLQLTLGSQYTLDHLHPRYATSTQMEASFNQLQSIGGLLILLTLTLRYGSPELVSKKLFRKCPNWLVFAARSTQSHTTGLDWIIWISPHYHDRVNVYDTITRHENRVGTWQVSMLSITEDFWYDGRSKNLFQAYGLIHSAFGLQVGQPPRLPIKSISTVSDLYDCTGLIAPRFEATCLRKHCSWRWGDILQPTTDRIKYTIN